MTDRLGVVVSGSLESGVEIKLDGSVSVEDMAVGRYVTIEGQRQRFFGMITDIELGVIDPRFTLTPPDVSDPFVSEVLSGTSTYGILHVLPMLTISGDVANLVEGPQPVKTVPSHFSVVNLASQADVELVFGGEDEKRFYVGTPLDMETKICLDLPELVKRSNGIFGKSGTGKTFLTRIIPHPHTAYRHAAEERGGEFDFRHAQRVRLGGDKRGGTFRQGIEAAISLEGGSVHP